MRFLNRYFFAGIGTGIVLTVGVLFLALFVLSRMIPEPGDWETALAAPRFPRSDRITVHGQADFAWSVRALDGREVAMTEFEGKVVFLNVWATWCGPCLSEMPSIQRLHESLEGREVVFVVVSEESLGTVKNFLVDKDWNLPLYVAREGLPEDFAAVGVPVTYIVDREGSIVFRHVGAADWGDDSCRRFIERLL